VWRHQRRSPEKLKFHENSFLVWELLTESFRLPFLPCDDCVTSDRSVDELLMRSHFFALHRRLTKRGCFSMCHQCLPLCYKTSFFAFSRFHTQTHSELFLLSLSRLRTHSAGAV
jgi:hypothetical protein